ncbi:MAG TPA: hypothetical protein VN853_22870 [Polyangia bacterium]|nr:hypothetical protein [Polyangia bacterium]
MASTIRSALTLAMLAAGCLASEPPPVPLYPNGATARLPPEQVADVSGPIEKIDGREVADQGRRFDLLPGCHIVQLDHQVTADSYSLSTPTSLNGGGQLHAVVFALRMKSGGKYIIDRQAAPGSMSNTYRVVTSAREELPGGAVTDLTPARSMADIKGCQAWSPSAGP